MLDIQGSIFHGSVIRDLIKPNMGGQLYAVGITIIVKHILVSMWIISKEDSFGYMVFQVGFLFPGVCTYTQNTKVQMEERLYCLYVAFLVGELIVLGYGKELESWTSWYNSYG